MVGWLYEVAKEVIYECLGKSASLHICIHIDILYKEACILEHSLYCNNIRMNLTPRERLHCHIYVLCAGSCNLQH